MSHPLRGTPGKGGDLVKFPLESTNFPLLEENIEQAKLRSAPPEQVVNLIARPSVFSIILVY